MSCCHCAVQTGPQNTLAGQNAGNAATPNAVPDGTGQGGYALTAYGAQTLKVNARGWKNTAVGHQALTRNTDGYRNTAIGNDALRENGAHPVTNTNTDPGSRNTAVGDLALVINTTGYGNTAVGVDAAQTNDTGDRNTAIGYLAYSGTWNQNTQHRKHSCDNTAVGVAALHFTGTGGPGGNANTAVGTQALRENTTGSFNVAVGYEANRDMAGTHHTVAVGARTQATHARSVALGADSATTGTDQVAIGDRYLELGPTSAIGFPTGNRVRLSVRVVNGKRQLVAHFPSGSVLLAKET